MRPSRVLAIYCAIVFGIGLVLSVPMAFWVLRGELSMSAAAVLTLCWNVFFLMTLPLIMDWSERKYCKARFVQLEELSSTNPQLKALLDEQCARLSLPGLRLGAVDSNGAEAFTYGLWHQNPRLIVPASWLNTNEQVSFPSIETALNHFAKRDVSIFFFAFGAVQVGLQFLLIRFWPVFS